MVSCLYLLSTCVSFSQLGYLSLNFFEPLFFFSVFSFPFSVIMMFVFEIAWYILSGFVSIAWLVLWYTLQNLFDFSCVFFPFALSCLSLLFSCFPPVACWVFDANCELILGFGRLFGQVMGFSVIAFVAMVEFATLATSLALPWFWYLISMVSFSHLVVGSFSLLLGCCFSPQKLKKYLSILSNSTPTYPTCAICLEVEVSQIFLPCAHIVCCEECSKSFKNRPCPLCRKKVHKVQTIYFAT